MPTNPSWVLRSYPFAMPSVENWSLEDRPVPEAADGELLVKTLWLSVDPYMRGRISPAKNYAAGFKIGDLMCGGGIGEVVTSGSADFKPGDIVISDYFGWQPFSVIPAASAKTVTTAGAPIQSALSYLGMPGLTAYFALLKTAAPKMGETVLISAASGAVGQIAGQIARIKGFDPVAVAGSDEKLEWCRELGYRTGINHRRSADLAADVASACPGGVDVFIDNTAGRIHDAAMSKHIEPQHLWQDGSGWNHCLGRPVRPARYRPQASQKDADHPCTDRRVPARRPRRGIRNRDCRTAVMVQTGTASDAGRYCRRDRDRAPRFRSDVEGRELRQATGQAMMF